MSGHSDKGSVTGGYEGREEENNSDADNEGREEENYNEDDKNASDDKYEADVQEIKEVLEIMDSIFHVQYQFHQNIIPE